MRTVNVIEGIFFAALEKTAPAERAAYLDQACGDDEELRRCVERMLAAQPHLGNFLQPAVGGSSVTTDAAPPLVERPGTVIGSYKLLEQLGEGGFGVVFLAEQSEPVRRKGALKIIKPGMDSRQVVARFEAERQALALMDHPNIARVFDGGTTASGRPYFVMELVKGVPITEFCDQNRLTPRERLELFIPVCQAVQHAHQKGIIHRDLKPSNVLVTLYDDKPVPKVIDFGVAKAVEQKLTEQTLFTRVGQVVGTLEYMSPEQASLNALDVDTRSDVYALGVLLYELLTGSTPLGKEQLQGVAFLEMLRLIREAAPPRPSMRLSHLGGGLSLMAAYRKTESQKLPRLMRAELDWIAMKALEKDRSRRYETASALAADVRRYLSEEPVEARAPSAGYRLRKFVKRHRGPVAAAAVVLLALVTGAIGTTWGMVEALTARNEEARQRQTAEGERNRAVTAEAKAKVNEEKAREEELKAKKATGEALRLAEEAKAARKLAQDHLTTAEWRLYVSHIASAQREWETDHVSHLYHYLNLSRKDFRAWEHDYLYTLANQYQKVLPLPVEKMPSGGRSRGPFHLSVSMTFSPDGKRLVIGSRNNDPSMRVLDLANDAKALSIETLGHRVTISPDGKRIATATSNFEDLSIKVWDGISGQKIMVLKGHRGCNFSLAFSPDGKRLVSAGSDGAVKLWDLDRGNEVITFQHHRADRLGPDDISPVAYSSDGTPILSMSVAFSPDGKQLASAGETVKVWDIASGKELKTFAGPNCHAAAFSPDGKRLAIAAHFRVLSGNGTAKVWELASGQEVFTRKGPVGYLAFSPDGKRLASGSSDTTVKLWDATSGQEVLTLKGHTAPVRCVTFSTDGKRLASASIDGLIAVWDASKSMKGTGEE